ncbi:unnamed protein product [Miscanthus lutarioriparius]|uniref:F-box domain-containing protein n=1 Tax=Miscanthus lutarioriparius TaxID=422564 RepID=A0A811RA89_9POAL|nr:unnamed protein product [Miscanthus lutarioriparius]
MMMKTTIDPAAAAPSTAAVILPDELIWEVLLHLPAKSLARFRCVCRSWNHLLRSDSDAAFQRLYSDRQQAAASVGLGRLAFAAARLAPPHPCEVCEGLTIMPCDGCPRFVGGGKPCHRGVALLSRPCTGAYTLCNVSTGGLLRLPPCPTVGLISAAGVGYLAATDEYKVVQLALVTDRPVWRLPRAHATRKPSPHGQHVGVSDYRLVMQPIGTALAELDGCLCMIRDLRRRRDVAAMFEVWKLKDYESGVWSLDYRIYEDLLATSSSSSQLTKKKLMEPWLVIPICYLPSDDGDDDDGDDRQPRHTTCTSTTRRPPRLRRLHRRHIVVTTPTRPTKITNCTWLCARRASFTSTAWNMVQKGSLN